MSTPFSVFTKPTSFGVMLCMADQDIRRENLQDIVKKIGLSEASKRFKKPDRQINDMLKNRKSFGEKVAKDMEDNYAPGVPNGWLHIPGIFLDNGDINTELIKVSDNQILDILGLKKEDLVYDFIEFIRISSKANKEQIAEAKKLLIDSIKVQEEANERRKGVEDRRDPENADKEPPDGNEKRISKYRRKINSGDWNPLDMRHNKPH